MYARIRGILMLVAFLSVGLISTGCGQTGKQEAKGKNEHAHDHKHGEKLTEKKSQPTTRSIQVGGAKSMAFRSIFAAYAAKRWKSNAKRRGIGARFMTVPSPSASNAIPTNTRNSKPCTKPSMARCQELLPSLGIREITLASASVQAEHLSDGAGVGQAHFSR